LLMIFGLNCAIPIRAPLRLILLVRILTICNIKPLLRKLESL
jgi:hypothetical protein